MLKKTDLVAVRDGNLNDKNFILATWLRNLYYSNDWFREIPKDTFMTHYHGVVEALLVTPITSVKIACLKDDPEVILGYSVYRQAIYPNGEPAPCVLDYVFVKAAWRKIGIAKSLVPARIDAVTHLTKIGKALKPKEAVFNPFLI